VRAALAWPGPLYLRFGKKPMPDLHEPGTPFEVGRAITLIRGTDVTFIATGEMVAEATGAARALAVEGLSCGVISMHTVKPLDHGAILQAATNSAAIITVEEHSVHGGLGSQCAALLMENDCRVRFRIMGIPDEHIVTGSQGEIFRHYGMDAPGLAAVARRLLGMKVAIS
jgi:transketolase